MTASDGPSLRRRPRRDEPLRVPRVMEGEQGLVVVDSTWGTINSISLHDRVRTVGELEVIAHLEAGLVLVDSRRDHYFHAGTIPGATNVPHPRAVESMETLDRAHSTLLFCNGPQCSATPQAIAALLGAGYPPEALLYYRGGMHDWMTLGLPTVVP